MMDETDLRRAFDAIGDRGSPNSTFQYRIEWILALVPPDRTDEFVRLAFARLQLDYEELATKYSGLTPR